MFCTDLLHFLIIGYLEVFKEFLVDKLETHFSHFEISLVWYLRKSLSFEDFKQIKFCWNQLYGPNTDKNREKNWLFLIFSFFRHVSLRVSQPLSQFICLEIPMIGLVYKNYPLRGPTHLWLVVVLGS